MSCRSTKSGTLALRLARKYSGLPDGRIQKLFHGLQREGKMQPEPDEKDYNEWYNRQLALINHAELTDSVRSRCLNELAVSQEEYLDGPLFHALQRIELRARQESVMREISTAVDLAPPGSQADSYVLGDDGRPEKVWYASYGSNMSRQRFMTYIQGGTPTGASTHHYGARDTTAPSGDIPIRFDGRMHFAYMSPRWGNGGVAFMDTDHAGHALGRAYQITSEQFDDVVAQENGRYAKLTTGRTPIPLMKVVESGREDISKDLYGTLIHIGDYENAPVFTFTSAFTVQDSVDEQGLWLSGDKKADVLVASNSPKGNYLRMIGKGLEESFGMTEEQQADYLRGCPGAEEWKRRELLQVLRAAEPEPVESKKSVWDTDYRYSEGYAYQGYGESHYGSYGSSTTVTQADRDWLARQETSTSSVHRGPYTGTYKKCPMCGRFGHTMHDCTLVKKDTTEPAGKAPSVEPSSLVSAKDAVAQLSAEENTGEREPTREEWLAARDSLVKTIQKEYPDMEEALAWIQRNPLLLDEEARRIAARNDRLTEYNRVPLHDEKKPKVAGESELSAANVGSKGEDPTVTDEDWDAAVEEIVRRRVAEKGETSADARRYAEETVEGVDEVFEVSQEIWYQRVYGGRGKVSVAEEDHSEPESLPSVEESALNEPAQSTEGPVRFTNADWLAAEKDVAAALVKEGWAEESGVYLKMRGSSRVQQRIRERAEVIAQLRETFSTPSVSPIPLLPPVKLPPPVRDKIMPESIEEAIESFGYTQDDYDEARRVALAEYPEAKEKAILARMWMIRNKDLLPTNWVSAIPDITEDDRKIGIQNLATDKLQSEPPGAFSLPEAIKYVKENFSPEEIQRAAYLARGVRLRRFRDWEQRDTVSAREDLVKDIQAVQAAREATIGTSAYDKLPGDVPVTREHARELGYTDEEWGKAQEDVIASLKYKLEHNVEIPEGHLLEYKILRVLWRNKNDVQIRNMNRLKKKRKESPKKTTKSLVPQAKKLPRSPAHTLPNVPLSLSHAIEKLGYTQDDYDEARRVALAEYPEAKEKTILARMWMIRNAAWVPFTVTSRTGFDPNITESDRRRGRNNLVKSYREALVVTHEEAEEETKDKFSEKELEDAAYSVRAGRINLLMSSASQQEIENRKNHRKINSDMIRNLQLAREVAYGTPEYDELPGDFPVSREHARELGYTDEEWERKRKARFTHHDAEVIPGHWTEWAILKDIWMERHRKAVITMYQVLPKADDGGKRRTYSTSVSSGSSTRSSSRSSSSKSSTRSSRSTSRSSRKGTPRARTPRKVTAPASSSPSTVEEQQPALPAFRSGKTMTFTVRGETKEVDISSSPLWDTAVEAVTRTIANRQHISLESARSKVALHHMQDVRDAMQVMLEDEQREREASSTTATMLSRFSTTLLEKARDTVVKEFANDFAISEDDARNLIRAEWNDTAEWRMLEILMGNE